MGTGEWAQPIEYLILGFMPFCAEISQENFTRFIRYIFAEATSSIQSGK